MPQDQRKGVPPCLRTPFFGCLQGRRYVHSRAIRKQTADTPGRNPRLRHQVYKPTADVIELQEFAFPFISQGAHPIEVVLLCLGEKYLHFDFSLLPAYGPNH